MRRVAIRAVRAAMRDIVWAFGRRWEDVELCGCGPLNSVGKSWFVLT